MSRGAIWFERAIRVNGASKVRRLILGRWRWWFGGGAATYATGLVLLRGAPTTSADAGVFLSVAGRLLRGDRLYVDVYDNKGPLFYYSYVGALGAFGWRGPFLLDIVWLAIAAAFSALFVRSIGGSRLLAAVAFFIYPLILSGTWYYAGYSRLAVFSIVPLIGWLWLRRNFAWAGVVVCAGLLFDLGLGLILVSVPLALLALGVPPGKRLLHAGRAAVGLVAAGALAAVSLALAGELGGYLHTTAGNFTYANNVLAYTGRRGGITGHLHVVQRLIPHFGLVLAAFLVAGAIAVYVLVRAWRARSLGASEAILAAVFLSTSLAVLVTLALTAAWGQHNQAIALPATWLVLLVLARLELSRPLAIKATAIVAVIAVAPLLLGGTIGGTLTLTKAQGLSLSSWSAPPLNTTAQALNQVRRTQMPALTQVTYAHLGGNDEEAHAVFTDDEFKLACPAFHQYAFTADLNGVLDCIRQKRPRLVFVTPRFSPLGGITRWNDFIGQGRRMLRNRYQKVLVLPTSGGNVEIWKLRPVMG
ncbi:MAG: hypothetical protein WBQ14_01430 [Gaiellaceae bacterium]